MNDLNISFAGAGRVATALAIRMADSGYNIERIVSRTPGTGQSLASRCMAEWSDTLRFPSSTNLIIVSVPDKMLTEVLDGISCDAATTVVHTAGSFGLEVFPGHIIRKGVFYPLQTFTIGRMPDFSEISFLLEAATEETANELFALAESIGGKPRVSNPEQRLIIHTAAVFICNFTNYMLTTGKNIAAKADAPFDIFIPLLKETISKALMMGPGNSQTGPAVRNDRITIEKHLELLSDAPELKKLYKEITESIIKYYKKS